LESLKKITESTNYTVLIKSLNFFKRTIFESKIIDIEKKNTIEENMVLIKETIIDRKKNRVFVKFGNDALKVPFEEKGFIKIDIDTMISLRGKHTLTIYEILKSYDYGKRNVPVISLYDLKELLGMNEDYRNNLIKPQIIIPAIKEIEKYTPLRIKYKMLKNGREISHIKFSFFNNNDKFIFQSNK
jgi:plasmid replication initiation protein